MDVTSCLDPPKFSAQEDSMPTMRIYKYQTVQTKANMTTYARMTNRNYNSASRLRLLNKIAFLTNMQVNMLVTC